MKTSSPDYSKSISYKDKRMVIKTLDLFFKREENTWITQNGLFSSVDQT